MTFVNIRRKECQVATVDDLFDLNSQNAQIMIQRQKELLAEQVSPFAFLNEAPKEPLPVRKTKDAYVRRGAISSAGTREVTLPQLPLIKTEDHRSESKDSLQTPPFINIDSELYRLTPNLYLVHLYMKKLKASTTPKVLIG